MRNTSLRVLLVEDNPADARLIRELLRDAMPEPLQLRVVDRLEKALMVVRETGFDVVLLDLNLPDSEGLETLSRFCEQQEELPVVVLTGLDDDVTAIASLQRGAQDYVTKNHLEGGLLYRSMRYAIEREHILREQKRLQAELRAALSHVKQLHGLLPICSYCKKVRDDQNYWHAVESYLSHHADVQFSHGMCPDCYDKLGLHALEEFRNECKREGSS